MIKELNTLICLEEKKEDWSENVEKWERALNARVSSSTGFSPNMLVYSDVDKRESEVEEVFTSLAEEEGVVKRDLSLKEMRMLAKKNIIKSQKQQKDNYDKRHRVKKIECKENDKILMWIPVEKVKSKKQLIKRGPFRVVKCNGNKVMNFIGVFLYK